MNLTRSEHKKASTILLSLCDHILYDDACSVMANENQYTCIYPKVFRLSWGIHVRVDIYIDQYYIGDPLSSIYGNWIRIVFRFSIRVLLTKQRQGHDRKPKLLMTSGCQSLNGAHQYLQCHYGDRMVIVENYRMICLFYMHNKAGDAPSMRQTSVFPCKWCT